MSFTHDGFGNRTNQTVTKGSAPSSALTFDANNRVPTFNQDNNGNVTWMPPGLTMTYDMENRKMSAQGSFGTERYGYDPGNHRVYRKKADGTEEFTVWGAQGERVEVFKISSGQAQIQTTNIYFAGRLMRTKNHTNGWETALITDRMGSVAVRVNPSGINEKLRYYPYGEEYAATTNDRDKFATYSRDSNTALDYALNRYYGSNMGRFLSPDQGPPVLANPSSWNRYTYGWNDPVNLNDPDGMLPANVGFDGGFGCVPTGHWLLGRMVDASNPCPPGTVQVYSRRGGGSLSPLRAAFELFDPFPETMWEWKGNGTLGINVFAPGGDVLYSLSGPYLHQLTGVNWAVVFDLIEAPQTITTWEALYAALRSNPVLALLGVLLMQTGDGHPGIYRSPADLEANCTPVGSPVIVPSTQRGNKGGYSWEQEYDCGFPSGHWTIHRLYDKDGKLIDVHSRPGGPKYGPKP